MVALSEVQKSQLRRKYEKLNSSYQRAIYVRNPELQQITTEEFRRIFEYNGADSERWPTLTDLEDHIRNIAKLRSMGFPASIY